MFAAFILVVAGCGPKDDKATKDAGTKLKDEPTKVAAKGKHDGWWCKEHGIPEHECLTCIHTEEELKKKGDWCEKHEFAKSQCFKCNPKLKEQFAAKYRAKYDKEPPPLEADEAEKKDGEKKDGEKKDAGKDEKK